MTQSVLRVSAIALGAAAFLSLSPLSAARADTSADTSAEPAPTPSVSAPASTSGSAPTASAPSLSEPAPTPSVAEAPSGGATAAQHPYVRHYVHRDTHRYAWRNGHRYGDNPLVAAATGAAGGVADLGSLAAYPFYCFPNYSSCPVHWYRY
jgi:hypothetical protein